MHSYDFCKPDESKSNNGEGAKVSENLGQILLGERIRTSPYRIAMLEPSTCQTLCTKKY